MSISSNPPSSLPPSQVDRVDVANAAKKIGEEAENEVILRRNANNSVTSNGNNGVLGSNQDRVGDNEGKIELNPAMTTSVSDSQHPDAHLEALDTIITCTTLQQTTSGEGQASIAALLRQAKTLLLDNTVTVILATLRELHRPEEDNSASTVVRLPAFWNNVRSSKELTSWLQLFDMILYCWGGQHGEAPSFVERYVRAYTEQIQHLRQLHDFDNEDLLDGGEGCVNRVQERLAAVKSALRPSHWTLVASLKKFNRAKLELPWHILTACLQLSGCLELSATTPKAEAKDVTGKEQEQEKSENNTRKGQTQDRRNNRTRKGRQQEKSEEKNMNGLVSLDDMKVALTKLTFSNLDRLADYESLAANPEVLQLLRHVWLPSPNFDEAKLRALDLTSMPNPAWHGVPDMAADFVAYLRAVEELARLRERLAMRKEEKLREAIYMRLLTMAAGQLTSVRRHQQWEKVPKPLKDAISDRRQCMTKRCSVIGGGADENLLSPTSSTASSSATSSSLSFSVGLESCIPISWNLTNVKSPMLDIL